MSERIEKPPNGTGEAVGGAIDEDPTVVAASSKMSPGSGANARPSEASITGEEATVDAQISEDALDAYSTQHPTMELGSSPGVGGEWDTLDARASGLDSTGPGEEATIEQGVTTLRSVVSKSTGSAFAEPGQLIDGRYRIVKLLARGNMGRVFLAEHEVIGRQVVLKIIIPALADEDEMVERFRREARVLARLEDPGIVTVYDLGRTDRGQPYIVMEYVDGISLADMIGRDRTLAPARAVTVIARVAAALHKVHEAQVIHRDLKPGNVLIGEGSSGLVVKIADFGLAKMVKDPATRRAGLTRVGTILGTPEYMAPEQIQGSSVVDRRADVYALGCVLYESLTGTPPFGGEELPTLYKHLHETAPPLCEACPDADLEPFQPVIDRALAKDVDERYENAWSFRSGLLAAAREAGVDYELSRSRTFTSSNRVIAASAPDSADTPGPITRRMIVERGSTARRATVGLIALCGLVTALAGGVAIGKWRFRSHAPSAAGQVAAPQSAALLVVTDPAGADCRLDGGEPRQSPAVFSQLAPGGHSLSVARHGYSEYSEPVIIEEGEIGRVDVSLVRTTHEVAVASVPAGATVYLDGAMAGTTPVSLALADGELHQILLRSDGYQPYRRLVGVGERIIAVDATLRPALLQFGTLFVDGPAGGRIEIDGTPTGHTAPTAAIQLAPGSHEITVVSLDGERRTRRVRIKRNTTTRASF